VTEQEIALTVALVCSPAVDFVTGRAIVMVTVALCRALHALASPKAGAFDQNGPHKLTSEVAPLTPALLNLRRRQHRTQVAPNTQPTSCFRFVDETAF
jgi:hypothetical protein